MRQKNGYNKAKKRNEGKNVTKEEFSAMKKPVLLDGATGSNLMADGMPRGVCTEQWVLEHPEVLLDLQREYVAAGTQILYAPTFSANRHALKHFGLDKNVVEMNRALVALSREAAGGRALVAGDLTTTGVPLKPDGAMCPSELFDLYAEQIAAQAEAGADLIVAETLLGIDEAAVALDAAQSVCALPVLCSLTVQADGAAYFGGNCVEAVRTLLELGAAAVGVNCSFGPEHLSSLVKNMKAVAHVPLLVKPNAGMPAIAGDGTAVYPMGPEEFARHMRALHALGADLIGGCCGTTPVYIAALRAALEGAR